MALSTGPASSPNHSIYSILRRAGDAMSKNDKIEDWGYQLAWFRDPNAFAYRDPESLQVAQVLANPMHSIYIERRQP
jgi:hypothetical protein